MTVHVGDYVKAAFEFPGEGVSDLQLSVGDVVRITDVVDENWAVGQKIGPQNVAGMFPLSFVERLTLPSISAGQKIFLSIEDFLVKERNDLELRQGDIILGTEAVDDMWWRGINGCLQGIFPLTFVVELEVDDITCFKLSSKQNEKSSLKGMKSQSDRGCGKDVNRQMTEVTLARALMNVTSQLDGELSFQQGELIEVTNILEDGWLYGRCGSKEGLLSSVCVELLDNVYSSSELGIDSKYEINLSTDGDSFHPSKQFGVLCLSSKAGDNNIMKPSASSTTKITVPTINPSLSSKAKPPIPPKPAVSHKPNISPKRFTVNHPNSSHLAKPVSASKSKVEQVTPSLGKGKTSIDSDPLVEQKCLETKNLKTSRHPKTLVDSASSALSVISVEKDCFDHSFINTEGYYVPYRKPEAGVQGLISTPTSISGTDVSCPITTAPEASFITSPFTVTSQQGSSDRDDISANSFRCSEDESAKSKAKYRRKSTSSAEQVMSKASNLSAHELVLVKDSFVVDVTDGTIADVNVCTNYVTFHRPARPALTRTTNAKHVSSVSDEPSSEKLKNSQPRPASRTSSVPLTLTRAESQHKPMPKRPAPKAKTNRSLDLSPPAQRASSYIPHQPRRPAQRCASFPSTPKRPPPRPRDFKFFTPYGLRTEETDLELVADLERKLEENQANIRKYEQTRSDLQRSVSQADTQTKDPEVQHSLELVERHLADLQEEERSLKENLFAASSQESKLEKSRLLAAQNAVEEEKRRDEEEKQRELEEKRKEEERKRAVEMKEKKRIHRSKVIEEIINTEKDYLFSLQLCLETFYDDQKPPARVDLDFLLGNMVEIADVSQKMLINLENCVSGKSLDEQCLGQCFNDLAEDMRNTYAPYCRNHDEVITAMEQFADSTEISSYFNSKIEMMKKQTNVFDMASILIRPVQRILKYPLLLNELLKNTEEGHPDREDIVTAIKEMTEVAKDINEYKRRKDLVYKYKNFTDETFTDKISKLNLHSIMKKSSRMRGRLSTNLGIALQTKDEVFDKEEAKFQHMDRTIKVFLNSIQEYLEQSQETIHCQTAFVDDIKDFYQGRESAEATKLYEVTCKQLSLFDSMKATVENNVVVPLNILIGLFSGPFKVIEKRFDKMLDYNYQLGKIENDKELQAAKNDYEAMNAQLLDELPKFYNLAFKMLRHCISVFILARRDFMDQSLRESCVMLGLPSMASKANLMDTFKIRHTTAFDHMSMLSFIPKGFNPRVDTVKADRVKQKGPGNQDGRVQQLHSLQSSSGSQNENKRKYLHQVYPPDKLYTVTSTYNAVDLMDISVTEGSLVGVVKELDPMGNIERWFVDDGGSKGFIPCGILAPLEYFTQRSTTNGDEEDDIISILSGDSGDSVVLTGNDDRVESHTNNSFTDSFSQPVQLPQYQYYYALYDFKPRNPNEASLTAGHPVTVLAFHDLDGNSEWWLVDSEGKRGYAPANYMSPMSYS